MSASVSRRAVLLGALAIVSPSAWASAPAQGQPAARGADGTSELEALSRELARSVQGLRLDDAQSPYSAELRIVRLEALSLDASYGGVITDIQQKQAFARLDLRVGSLAQDDSGFFGADSPGLVSLPLMPDPLASPRLVWLVADASYRAATGAFRAKESALRQLAETEETPDHVAPVEVALRLPWAPEGTWADPKLEDMPVDRVRLHEVSAALSGRFANHPRIDNGDVFIQCARTYETLLDDRGLAQGWVRDRSFVAVVADARAQDGMQLDHGGAWHLQGFPTPEEAEARGVALVDEVLAQLELMLDAPMIEEDYDGPILFEHRAAAQLWASTIHPHASGTPAPLSEWGRVLELEPHWLERLGRPVLPDWLSLIDDPTAKGFGQYTHDSQGVVGERLELVERGLLSTLLMTRRPNEKIGSSNGHARAAFDLAPAASFSNLEVRAYRRGLKASRLERELLRRAREDGYDYAYVVATLRDGGVLGPVPRDAAEIFATGRKVSLPIPALIYRLSSDGTRTLVRGALLSPASMRVLRRIREISSGSKTFDMRLTPGGSFAVDLGADALLSQTVDVSVSTPALLVDGLELVLERGEHERAPRLEHPLRRLGESP